MAKQPKSHPILETPRLRLRQFRAADAEAIHDCFGDAQTMRFWSRLPHSKRIETERAVRNMTDCTPAYYRFWAVADAATDRCLGLASYHDGHIRSKRAAIGYMIEPSRLRQGLGSEAVGAVLEYCFGVLGLNRLEALINPANAASQALVAKFGFRCEGVLRQHLRVGEDWRDEMMLALLASERGG